MQVPIEQISFEDQIKELSRVLAGCIREEFEDDLPNATVTIYVKQPKSGEQGTGESAFRYDISDDSVSDETVEYQMNLHREPLIQRFLDKVSLNYRESGRYQGHDHTIRFLGRVLEVKDLVTVPTEHLDGHPDLNESDFREIAEFALEKHWVYKIKIDRDLAIEMVKFTVPLFLQEIAEHGPEFIEFVKENFMN